MLCGDLESNPGPLSVNSLFDSNLDSSSYSISNLTNHLSIMHLIIKKVSEYDQEIPQSHIKSLVPNVDLIE